MVAPPSLKQVILRRLTLKRYLQRPVRRPSLSKFFRMAQPPDPARHSYTGQNIRQKLKNMVGTYAGYTSGSRDISDPGVQARMVEDSLAQTEENRKVSAKDADGQGEEKLVLFPTYARIKPHLFHGNHLHSSTSSRGMAL